MSVALDGLAGIVSVGDAECAASRVLERASFDWFAGGAGAETTLRRNLAAFDGWRLRPRVLVDVGDTSTETTVLGRPTRLPVLVGPFSLQHLAHPDGELAVAAAAAARGVTACFPAMLTATSDELSAAAAGGARWAQLYWYRDAAIVERLVAAAAESGAAAIVLTVDRPRAGLPGRERRNGFAIPDGTRFPTLEQAIGRDGPLSFEQHAALISDAVTWDDVARLARRSPLPLVLKGILTGEDAGRAVDCGAAAIVVSNHGGRVLDGAGATLDALPEVVEAVAGRIQVLLDGGVRRGADVVTALALGARAVLVARPIAFGLAAGGRAGVERVLRVLGDEIEATLALLGRTRPEAVQRGDVQEVAGPRVRGSRP